ncbi:MAG TPA: LTA synthase family protein [Firmicutes bacterium]|nr:LTA synthase family protein [Bacillota bacterium]
MSFKLKRFKINIKLSLAIMLAASIVTLRLMFFVSPEYTAVFSQTSAGHLGLIFLNYIPIPLVMLLLYFISGNCIFASGISMLVFTAGAYANGVKTILRQDPLIPSDLSVITEVGSILSSYDEKYMELAIAAVFAIVVICAAAFIFFKKSDSLTGKKRIAGSAACFILFAGLLNTVYANSALYGSFGVEGNIYFKVNQYMSKGFLYSFLYDVNNLNVEKPGGYDRTEFVKASSDTQESENGDDSVLPNIIMVMSEAFSDVSNSDFLSFDGFDDPLEFYNDFISGDDVVSGHIVVPNFGGGTSDTEFDVLTGCSTKYIESTQVSYNFVRSPIESLPRMLEKAGYDTLAIHPGYGWFYNRTNVYENMGFDDFLYLENDFDPETQNKGGYISDEVTAASIIENYEKHVESSDDPLFEFCVTIQNHGPYEEKYGDLETNFTTDVYLTDEEKAIYSGYFEGIDDADAQIETLIDYFEDRDEPVALVFFGDHLPGFSNGLTYFSQFRPDIDINGNPYQRLKVYETPYFIWVNDVAMEQTNFAENLESIDLPPNNLMSSFYLGTTVLELFDLDWVSEFYQFLNELRVKVPVAWVDLYLMPDGSAVNSLSVEDQGSIDKYRRWIYYKIFDEEVS